jgi:hypothetical protein
MKRGGSAIEMDWFSLEFELNATTAAFAVMLQRQMPMAKIAA